jgi:hypothetical protein
VEAILQSTTGSYSYEGLHKSNYADNECGVEIMAKRKQKKSKSEKKLRKVKSKPIKKKQAKLVKEKLPKEKLDPRIEEIYEKEITFQCPVRGLVKQKVKVKRYKPLAEQQQKPIVNAGTEFVDKLEEKDDGLSIYDDGEALGITGPSSDGDTE